MNVLLLTVGRLKESYWRQACAEYEKRLGRYGRVELVELLEERLPEKPSPAQIRQGLEAEGKRMISKLPDGCLTVALCIEGRQCSSPQLAKLICDAGVQGKSTVCFCIGSSFGLDDVVKARADVRLSMSPMTFPHQLARVMLLEQVYRAFTINANEKYHK